MKSNILLTSSTQATSSTLLAWAKVFCTLSDRRIVSIGRNNENILEARSSNSEPLICLGTDSDSTQNWLWGEIRNQQDILNPIIILYHGSAKEIQVDELFQEKWNLKQHRHFTPPWKLPAILSALNEIEPLYCDSERVCLVESYAYGAALNRILTHDLLKVDRDIVSRAINEALEIANNIKNPWLVKQFLQCEKIMEHESWVDIAKLATKIWHTIRPQITS